MSYNPSIPNVTDFIALSKKQMVANFQAIDSAFFTNHIALTAVDNIGMHKGLVLRPQSGDPTTGSDQCALYNKVVSSEPQLFFRPKSNGTPIQVSNSNLNTLQTGAPKETQSSFLAGPFTIYMGYVANCPNGQVVTLLPSSTLLYVGLSVILSNMLPDQLTTAAATNISTNQFTVAYNTAQIPNPPIVYYTAIGQ